MAKIFIDAGHGGHDPGAVGSRSKEKDDVLKVANRIKVLLESHGHTVKMSRSTDVFIALSERARLGNATHGVLTTLLVCIITQQHLLFRDLRRLSIMDQYKARQLVFKTRFMRQSLKGLAFEIVGKSVPTLQYYDKQECQLC